jgi:hypothetical protein
MFDALKAMAVNAPASAKQAAARERLVYLADSGDQDAIQELRRLDQAVDDNVRDVEKTKQARVTGGKNTRKWTDEIDAKARKILATLPAGMSKLDKAKRIAPHVGRPAETVRQHLFYAKR